MLRLELGCLNASLFISSRIKIPRIIPLSSIRFQSKLDVILWVKAQGRFPVSELPQGHLGLLLVSLLIASLSLG